MFSKSFFGFLLYSLILYPSSSVSVRRWIFNFSSPLQESNAGGFSTKINEDGFSKQVSGNNSDDTTESSDLFWTMPDVNGTVEPDLQVETDAEMTSVEYEALDTTNESTTEDQKPTELIQMDQVHEENKDHEAVFDESNLSDSMDEKIVLQRNNCNLEIPVEETQTLKMEIEFQKLENNTSGKCCITLNGHMNSLLGVLISNIHLYQNASKGEVIKVITTDYGSDFVLKEYYPSSKYEPLLLTETHKVFIMLQYEVTNVPLNEQNSRFNLEVFSYHKHENSIYNQDSHYQTHFSNKPDDNNFSQAGSSFFSYFYK